MQAPPSPSAPSWAPPPTVDWRDRLARWWAEFSLQTKLLAVATLVVSLLMTGITFFALNGIRQDARMSDTRYARDLGLLLAANISPLVAQGQDRELAEVSVGLSAAMEHRDIDSARGLRDRWERLIESKGTFAIDDPNVLRAEPAVTWLERHERLEELFGEVWQSLEARPSLRAD
ncbi:MAG: hypothetical protein ACKOZW_03775, partial [Cyanobium sp.]